jgi:hypothetical protein
MAALHAANPCPPRSGLRLRLLRFASDGTPKNPVLPVASASFDHMTSMYMHMYMTSCARAGAVSGADRSVSFWFSLPGSFQHGGVNLLPLGLCNAKSLPTELVLQPCELSKPTKL